MQLVSKYVPGTSYISYVFLSATSVQMEMFPFSLMHYMTDCGTHFERLMFLK